MCKWDRAWATKWGESVLLTPHHKWSNVPLPQHKASNIQTCLLVLLLSSECLISNLSGHVKTVEGCAKRLTDPCRGQLWLQHLKPKVATVLKPLPSYCLFSPLRLRFFRLLDEMFLHRDPSQGTKLDCFISTPWQEDQRVSADIFFHFFLPRTAGCSVLN